MARIMTCLAIACHILFSFCLSALGQESPESSAQADAKSKQELNRFFEAKVRPLLAERCWNCHGPDEQKGDLRLDSLVGILQGGESGSSVVPGKSTESLVIEAIRYDSLEMPPDKKLSEDEIDVLTRWVDLGAYWPDQDGVAAERIGPKEKITDEDRKWWAFQKIQEVTPPSIVESDLPAGFASAWNKNPIDAFTYQAMNGRKLTPAPQADRISLIRRAYFDLVGLPPPVEKIQAFLADESPDAFEKVIDSLLNSPQYGERWARHWLDLVRYADSDGYRIDHYRPNAWRYRDYVVSSFNNDKPYNRFIQEQIAGDEMFPNNSEAAVATGYLRHWIYEYNNRDVKSQWQTIMNDITDTTGDVFLGMGFQCAKCHDHKYDPILQKDYYRLQAFFAATIPRDEIVATEAERAAHDEAMKSWNDATQEIRDSIAAIEAPHREKAAQEAIGRFPADIQAIAHKPANDRSPYESQLYELVERQIYFEYDRIESKVTGEKKDELLALKKKLAQLDTKPPAPLPKAMVVHDVGIEAPPVTIPKKGKKPVEPGYLTVLDESPASIEPFPLETRTTGRRTTLAKWLSSDSNPLTTRVIVNRVWQYHFGTGLAPNASDLGKLGGAPSHPELLEWLTEKFIRDGWSLKSLHRRIMTSATYQQSVAHPQFAELRTIDPLNQYYWRGNTRRLDAEQIRDALLAVTSQLNATIGGEGVLPDIPRRSIYTRVMRNGRDPLLDAFDLPLFFSSQSSRNTTTTPIQSLLLINSPEMLRHAKAFASKVQKESDSALGKIESLWKTAYGRTPTDEEVKGATAFLAMQAETIKKNLLEREEEAVVGHMSYRDGQALMINPQTDGKETGKKPKQLSTDKLVQNFSDFSLEACFQLRSVYEDGQVRTIAAKWNGQSSKPGWAFGVTGKASRRKPQTLVLQMWGELLNGSFGEAAVFSDQAIELNKPYFAAVTVQMAGEKPGSVTFYLKDLSNDDEPIQVVERSHEIVGKIDNGSPFTIGGRSSTSSGTFDGFLDDVRLSNRSLESSQLLLESDIVQPVTVGYWRFESEPGALRDSSPYAINLKSTDATQEQETPEFSAFVDLCHAVLNSNEFLYIK